MTDTGTYDLTNRLLPFENRWAMQPETDHAV
jgi:hypothetical protein